MAVSPEKWQRIKTLFEEALEQRPEEREAFLAAQTDDEEVLEYVQRLLASEEGASQFFDTLGSKVQQAGREETIHAHPDQIGPWKVLGAAGRGGMGCVYEAERADGLFDQRVAIKVVDSHAPRLVKRFRQERRILASLEHPNICRLVDGGALDDGRPYLVMEFVEGKSITAYADEHSLSIDERLELFIQVCSAVSFAHRHLVIHRDLKPSNVLVTPDGTVKLLDFGIATLLDENGDEAHIHTKTGRRLLTPHFAAPEQIRNEPITTAADVYALGVLLYVLLVGGKPFGDTGGSHHEIEQTILEKDAQPPSTSVQKTNRADADRLSKQLRGDLDRIILKTLRKEPGRRYASVEAFCRDLQRHRDGLPVEARSATVGYRMKSFAKRHRTGVSVGVAALAALVLLSTLFALRITAERNRAQDQAERAEQVSEFLSDILTAADDPTVNAAVFLRLLEPAIERADAELADDPEAQGVIHQVVGSLYHRAGRSDLAMGYLLDALWIRQSLHPNGSLDEAETLHILGKLHIGTDHDSAAVYFQQAAEMQRELLGGDNVDLGWSLMQWARMLPTDDPEKQPLFEQAMSMLRRIQGDDGFDVAHALHEYHVLGFSGASGEEIMAAFRESIRIYEETGHDRHPFYLQALHNLGLVLDSRNEPEEGLELLRQSVELAEEIVPRGAASRFTMEVNLGATLHERGHFQEADEYLRETASEMLRILPDSSSGIGHSHYWFGRNLISLGQYDEAESALRLAHDIIHHHSSDGARRYRVLVELAYAQHLAGNQVDAERNALLAVEQLTETGFEPIALERGISVFEGQAQASAWRARLAELDE